MDTGHSNISRIEDGQAPSLELAFKSADFFKTDVHMIWKRANG